MHLQKIADASAENCRYIYRNLHMYISAYISPENFIYICRNAYAYWFSWGLYVTYGVFHT